MYNLKGFYTYPALISNEPDKVAILGEISDNSLTFAKDKTILTDAIAPNTGVISFHSVMDENPVQVPVVFSNITLKLGEYLYQQSLGGTITNDPLALKQLVSAEFPDLLSFTTGKMIHNGTMWLPEWIEFELDDPETNLIHIWLADDSFAGQYDGYVIEIIHPIVPFNDFFKDPLEVKQLLDNYNMVEKMEEVQARRAQYPYTYQRAFTYDYVNPRDSTQRYKAYWIAIIYGEAGNNPDLIREKIVKDLLEGSNHDRTEWETILPDLFMTTEFIFTPLWKQYAVPQADFRAGIHSPTVDYRKNLDLIRRTARGVAYSQVYVDNHFETSAHIYKSLAFAVVGNPQNRSGITQFSVKFFDYIVAETDSADINRLRPETVEWMMLFAKLIKAAESMTKYTSVPQGISRMQRDGVLYASVYFKNTNYLVVTKGSVETLS